MFRWLQACAVSLAFLAAPPAAHSGEVALQFSGAVGSLFPPDLAWGRTIPILTPVTGRFVYDSAAPAEYVTPGCDCTGYLQEYVGGFSASFGDLAVRADQYVIDVSNDIDQGGGVLLDFISVRWGNDVTPSLTAPLLVNETVASTGMFTVAFGFDPTTFTSSALPTSLNLANMFLPSEFNMLGDNDPFPGFGDVVFGVESVAAVSFVSGDYDYDEDVDGADLLQWQRTNADAAGLSAWSSGFGAPPSSIGAAATIVPEPQGLFVAAVPALIVAVQRSLWRPQRPPRSEVFP